MDLFPRPLSTSQTLFPWQSCLRASQKCERGASRPAIQWEAERDGTDEFEAADAVVDHAILRRKPLQVMELDIFHASEHFTVVSDHVLLIHETEVSSWRFPHNVLSVKLAGFLNFVLPFIVKVSFHSG
jgi:hypothetical protein